MTELAFLADSGLGLPRGTVSLVGYDRRWPVAFHTVAAALWRGAPDSVVAIEHIGSTAVPLLPAKPILDVLVGIREDTGPEEAGPWLNELSFQFRSVQPDEGLNLNYGFELVPRVRLVNLHLVYYGHPVWRDYLIFRDRLRADPGRRQAYSVLKTALAAAYPADRGAYLAGKDEFIKELLQRL